VTPSADFNVTLHHLSPDVTQAGAHFQDMDYLRVKTSDLRRMLEALAVLAPKVEFPAEPELRIAGPHGRFLVQAKNGQVKVISWSSQTGTGGEMTPDRIYAMIVGMESGDSAREPAGALERFLGGVSPRSKVAILAVAILGSNAITAWFLTRPNAVPPRELLPEYRPVAADQAKRIFDEFAGEYESGVGDARRQLTIGHDGTLHWEKFGANETVEEDVRPTAQAAESHGHPVLVASNYGMIEAKDAISVVYFGDTYRRKGL